MKLLWTVIIFSLILGCTDKNDHKKRELSSQTASPVENIKPNTRKRPKVKVQTEEGSSPLRLTISPRAQKVKIQNEDTETAVAQAPRVSLRPRVRDNTEPAIVEEEQETLMTARVVRIAENRGSGSDELGGGGGSNYAPRRSLMPRPRPSDLEDNSDHPLHNDYPPRVADFMITRSYQDSMSWANADWSSMSMTDRGEYIKTKYVNLLEARGLTGRYSPRILTCKAYKESKFSPQWRTAVSGSSASGLSQVTITTLNDTFDRYDFRSVVPGFENITTGQVFRERMKSNMIAQMDIGIGVLEAKRRDHNLNPSNIKSFLRRYIGSPCSSCNTQYANSIYSCALCIKNNGGVVSQRCLDEAS